MGLSASPNCNDSDELETSEHFLCPADIMLVWKHSSYRRDSGEFKESTTSRADRGLHNGLKVGLGAEFRFTHFFCK